MNLSKLSNVFVQIGRCICTNCQMYFSKLEDVFVRNIKCIYPMYLNVLKVSWVRVDAAEPSLLSVGQFVFRFLPLSHLSSQHCSICFAFLLKSFDGGFIFFLFDFVSHKILTPRTFAFLIAFKSGNLKLKNLEQTRPSRFQLLSVN